MRLLRPLASVPLFAAGAALALVATAAPAAAHVTISTQGEKGGFGFVSFTVPNERDDAATVTVEVQLPRDHPLGSVSVQPKPGWTVETTTRTLDEPVVVFGQERTEVVDVVRWSGGRIEPGQFDTFTLRAGPFPEEVDELVFPTIQIYSSGEEVAWIEPPVDGAEPDNPAPVLTLVEPQGAVQSDHGSVTDGDGVSAAEPAGVDGEAASAAAENDDGADAVSIVALVVAVIAALLSGAALLTNRRRAVR